MAARPSMPRICFVCAGGISRSFQMKRAFSRFLAMRKVSIPFTIINTNIFSSKLEALSERDIIVVADTVGKGYEQALLEIIRYPKNILHAKEIDFFELGSSPMLAPKLAHWGETLLTKINLMQKELAAKSVRMRARPRKKTASRKLIQRRLR